MSQRTAEVQSHSKQIAILGVPFDYVTLEGALGRIEEMISSGCSQYLVTANVDFLVQARADVELRRILREADLVLCDGTPVVWASRLLGEALPERVAGADLVPRLIHLAAEKGYRIFLLGATQESCDAAVARMRAAYPKVIIAGHYSPPFKKLLEMDHAEIRRRIQEARPDLLFVSFGCPKQEKWIAMHYRNLGVPVAAGVGATIDFLAGTVRRAPAWMQRTGTEWLFRLAQEPRRLFGRYARDLVVFSCSLMNQFWHLRPRRHWRKPGSQAWADRQPLPEPLSPGPASTVRLPERFDLAALEAGALSALSRLPVEGHCFLFADEVKFIDSSAMGRLLACCKNLRAAGKQLVLVAPSPVVERALSLMRLDGYLPTAPDFQTAQALTANAWANAGGSSTGEYASGFLTVHWAGEITAANADQVWEDTAAFLREPGAVKSCLLDLAGVSFIDSTGLGLLVRLRKSATGQKFNLRLQGLQPAVLNVIQLAKLEEFLIGSNLEGVSPGRTEPVLEMARALKGAP